MFARLTSHRPLFREWTRFVSLTLAGQPLRLWGSVFENLEPSSERVDARWYIDGEEVADGLDVYVAAPPGGEHEVRLVVRTERGESDAVVRIVSLEAG
jgi:hypothetical protein